ncbi:unnamed protein product, partial [marine sediment metagenome]
LIESIKAQGVIQPIIVRQIGDIYEVDIGRRRFLSAKEAGLEEIPCIVREMTFDEAMDASISENIFRKDVDPVTLGWWVKGRLERSGMSLRELARELGKDKMALSRWRTMTDLTEEMQQEVRRETISLSDALKVARMNLPPEKEMALAREAREGGSDSFKKTLDRIASEQEKRGAPPGLLITRINWGFESKEYIVLQRLALADNTSLSEFCQKILIDYIKDTEEF